MFFTFLVVAILTAVVLVVAGYPDPRTVMGTVQGRLLPVCHLVPDVRHRDRIPLPVGECSD